VKVSVVIPCYNSESTIYTVVDEIVKYFRATAYSYQIILVDDYSTDGISRVFSRLVHDFVNVTTISLSKNFGQHAAIMAGLNQCDGDVIVVMDDDGQTPPEEMYKLLEGIDQGYDAVYANYDDKKHSSFRNLGSRVNDYMLVRLLGKPPHLYISSYFAVRKYVVDEVIRYKNSYAYLPGLVLRATRNITNVPVAHKTRSVGKSNYSIRKLLALWSNGFTAFSVAPLRVASTTGLVMFFVGMLGVAYIILGRFNANITVPGWSSIMVAILISNGVTLLFLGLIGEYIGRAYMGINASPQYVVRQVSSRRLEIVSQ